MEDTVIKKCSKCGDIARYSPNFNVHRKNGCNGDLIQCNISDDDYITLWHIAKDNDFFQAMIDLKEKDIIEYNLKMSQFRSQVQQKKSRELQNDTTPRCPNCRSSNIQKIGGLERAGSVAMFGIFSKKINKSFKCNNCGYTW